ncbi:asparagine synthase (glutamine-hydrolyzing) [Candidatus Marinimicrobia bacterium]|nr:asparagine synthase (glutamine-hydrolyzing) [Candidatus Neomarinimicrobiota bacterium]
MCGIYGSTKIYQDEIIKSKLQRIEFRGPDNSDFGLVNKKVILGHNRLSIIDINERSNQPFRYHHLTITFNGQIYNFKTIKDELISKGFSFTTESDTEVLCASYLHYGSKCVEKLNGMFAFVIYDEKRNILFGARDRLGQKPFYYTTKNNCFEFSSQLSSLVIGNDFSIDNQAVNQFLVWNYIPEPKSIYNGVKKLEAGHQFTYDLENKIFNKEKYWDLNYSTDNQENIDYETAKERMESYLRDSIKIRMISDVPLGIFLSGGIDSSLIAYLAQDMSESKIKTFSIKFNEQKFDESIYAERVASNIKSDHKTILCDYEEGLDLINNYHYYYDEPFADASAIPSLLLSKHTRKHVTVALSGDAGDESFLGYNRYDSIEKWSWFFGIPYPLRKLASFLFKIFPNDRSQIYSRLLDIKDKPSFYKRFVSTLNDTWLKDSNLGDNLNFQFIFESKKSFLEQMSDFDLKTYLNGDINTKVDRASMAFSLETRSPLIDYRIIEFSRSLPLDFKYKDKNKKRILKDILYKYMPKELFDRPKSGFTMPLEIWFRKDLKEFVLDNLTENSLKEVPNLNVGKTLQYIDDHMQGKHNRYDIIWKLLVLMNWKKENNATF